MTPYGAVPSSVLKDAAETAARERETSGAAGGSGSGPLAMRTVSRTLRRNVVARPPLPPTRPTLGP